MIVFVLDYVKKYATDEATSEQLRQATSDGATCSNGKQETDDSDSSSLSDYSEDEAHDMELWPDVDDSI